MLGVFPYLDRRKPTVGLVKNLLMGAEPPVGGGRRTMHPRSRDQREAMGRLAKGCAGLMFAGLALLAAAAFYAFLHMRWPAV